MGCHAPGGNLSPSIFRREVCELTVVGCVGFTHIAFLLIILRARLPTSTPAAVFQCQCVPAQEQMSQRCRGDRAYRKTRPTTGVCVCARWSLMFSNVSMLLNQLLMLIMSVEVQAETAYLAHDDDGGLDNMASPTFVQRCSSAMDGHPLQLVAVSGSGVVLATCSSDNEHPSIATSGHLLLSIPGKVSFTKKKCRF